MVSTPLKNISQNGNLPQLRVNIKHIRNDHLDKVAVLFGESCEKLIIKVCPHHGLHSIKICEYLLSSGRIVSFLYQQHWVTWMASFKKMAFVDIETFFSTFSFFGSEVNQWILATVPFWSKQPTNQPPPNPWVKKCTPGLFSERRDCTESLPWGEKGTKMSGKLVV